MKEQKMGKNKHLRLFVSLNIYRGFSLVEMCMVLIIATLIMGTVLKAINAMQYSTKAKETRTNLALIKEALQRYYVINGRLPCPADPRIPDVAACGSYANQGAQGTHADLATLSFDNACGQTNAEFRLGTASLSGRAYRGAVPWKTLGLSREVAEDGYFNQIDYVVSARAIIGWDPNSTTGSNWVYLRKDMPQSTGIYGNLVINSNSTPAIEVSDGTLNSAGVATNRPVVALVSHGQNTWGARIYAETAQNSCVTARIPQDTANSGAGETQNIDNDLQFTMDTIGTSTGNQAYDDIGLYMTASEMMQYALQNGEMKTTDSMLTKQFEAAADLYFQRLVAVNKAAARCGSGGPNNDVCENLTAPAGATTSYQFTSAGPTNTQPYWRNAATDCNDQLPPGNPNAIDGTTMPGSNTAGSARPIRTLRQILAAGTTSITDPWGMELRYAVGPHYDIMTHSSCNVVAFVSYGPDMKTGGVNTKDDVVYFVSNSDARTRIAKFK